MKVFLSCVSAQFKPCRDALASDLRASGCTVNVQEDAQQGPRTLIERIAKDIADCDRVILLIGDGYGLDAIGEGLPAGAPQRSITQWEWHLARGERLDGSRAAPKDLWVYVASARFLAEHAVAQAADAAERQRAFVAEVEGSGKDRREFDSPEDLCRCVLRDSLKIQERPRRPSNLPYGSLKSLFKGRERFLDDLYGRLRRETTYAAAIVAQQAIHGLGGVGKTRLAVEYALRHEAEYCALLFVMAETPEDLRRNLAALCDPLVLDLPEHVRELDLPEHVREDDVRFTAALRWLTEHSGWLVIFDNVDTPEAQAEVERLFAHLRGGHVLVTSRRSHWGAGVERMALDVLAEDDAVIFLLERTNGDRQATESDAADARELARELGGLALALEQAGAFIATRHESLGGYLRRWRERETKVREWHDEALMHYPRSVAVTWDTSVEQLDAGALALLRMLCWLAPEPIPRALLATDEAQQALEQAAGRLVEAGERARGATSTDVEDALAGLASLSLVKWESGHALHLHRLVGDITRQRVPSDQRQSTLSAVLGIVNAYLPDDPPPWDVRSWPRWQPVQGHVAALVGAADVAGIAQPTSRLMDMLGGLLNAKGVWAEAEALLRRALAIDESTYGPSHPSVVVRLNNLAQLLQVTNRLAEAEPLMRRALAIAEASYGPDHTDVARSLNNLALLLHATNGLAEAESLLRRALAIDEANCGPDHPDVARDVNNLAQLLRTTNRASEAEPLMRRVAMIWEAQFGTDHPNVATALNNLGLLLHEMQRPLDAEPLMRRALAIDEGSYGPEHRDVGRDLTNLAALLCSIDRVSEAEPLMRRVVALWESTLGVDHPNVATAVNNLARLLHAADRLAEAEPLMRRAVAIDEASYGPDHPDLARDLNNLALLLKDATRFAEAELLMRRAVVIFLRFQQATNHEHPNFRDAIDNYVDLLTAMGCDEVAARVEIAALAAPFGVSIE